MRSGAAAGVYPQVGEGRDEVADRVGELERALLVQHHDRHRGDRLGHRKDPEQGVGPHRRVVGDVPHAVRREVRDLALPGHEHQPTGQLAGLHIPGEVLVDSVQPGGVEPDLAGVHLDFQAHLVLLRVPSPVNVVFLLSRPDMRNPFCYGSVCRFLTVASWG